MDSNNDEMNSNNDEMNSNNTGKDKKRKSTSATGDDSMYLVSHLQQFYNNCDFLNLSLSSFPSGPPPPPPQNMPFINSPRVTDDDVDDGVPLIPGPRRLRRNPGRALAPGRSATISPPYPWADTGRATVRSLSYLRENQIFRISGDVQCKKCEQRFQMEFNLEQNFKEVTKFIVENKANMHHRAPKAWMSPALPKCSFCNQENSVRPVIAEKKRAINWLFLLLGQMMGCCTLDQLKYFCKHTKNHRTGAKDRVLFLAYLGLCSQLDPSGPFGL